MLNLVDKQTILPSMSRHAGRFQSRVSSEENLRANHLNL